MKSIWSSEYQASHVNFELNSNQKENLASPSSVKRVSTKGMEKLIDVNYSYKETIKNKAVMVKSESQKRKSECIISETKPSGNKFINEAHTMDTPKEKKLRSTDIKVDIDTILSQYSINMPDDELLKDESPYFTSSNPSSPVLKKVQTNLAVSVFHAIHVSYYDFYLIKNPSRNEKCSTMNSVNQFQVGKEGSPFEKKTMPIEMAEESVVER
jgi:hypothetical protein